MAGRREIVFDAWTPLSFKRVLGNKVQPGHQYEQPSWVGDHARRLMAYKVLQAYVDNSAREFLATTDEAKIEEHREYGDAALIRNTILAALLGNDQEIVVGGADSELEDEKAEAAAKLELQEWLRKQWVAERGPLKLQETERDAVGLGDGVYSIGWSSGKGRARIRCWDPGFYFPVLTDGNEDDYPDKVHFAWEVPEADRLDKNKMEIRRITLELVDWDPWTPAYAAEGDPAATKMCLYSDALFQVERGKALVYELDASTAIWQTGEDGEPLQDIETELDFLPVIHIPNTVAIKNHYGQSSLSVILQILDDLANADTDLQAASATAGRPVMVLSGGTLGKKAPNYNPGEVWEVGDGGLAALDTSKSLDAILKYVEFLLGRLSTSARTPDALLGRVDPSKVDAGIVLALSFGPLASMVAEMRLSRDEKYPLLLKFLWRVNVANGAQDAPDTWYDSTVQLGSYLPQDKAAMVTMVGTLLQAKAISRETGVKLLMSVGFPIEDAEAEIQLIQSRDFAGAAELRDAVDSDKAVLDYLGMDDPGDITEPPEPPVLDPANPDQPPVPVEPEQPEPPQV